VARGVFKPCREAATAALSIALPRFGFSNEPLSFANGVFRKWWVRDRNWKWDVVELAYRRGGHVDVPVNLQVVLPLGADPQLYPAVDGCGVDTPTLPYYFPSLRVKRYGARVARRVEASLHWFDGLSSAAQCLAALSSGINNGPHGGTTWHQMKSHLNNVE
jgi:hypothetical protein